MATDLDQRVREMIDARRAALTTQARRDATMSLLDAHGVVTEQDVQARLRDTFALPDDATLYDQMARKAAAAVDSTLSDADAAQAAYDQLQVKRDKVAAQLAGIDDALSAADAEIEQAGQRVLDAQALAEHLGAPGHDQSGPGTTATAAAAGVGTDSAGAQARGV